MVTLTLLAAAQTVAETVTGENPVLTPLASGEPQMNLWDMACKGGWIMIVLAVMSVIAFYIFFERAVVIRKAGKEDPLFMERIRDYVKSGEIKSAINGFQRCADAGISGYGNRYGQGVLEHGKRRKQH